MARWAPYRTCPACGSGFFAPPPLPTYWAAGTAPVRATGPALDRTGTPVGTGRGHGPGPGARRRMRLRALRALGGPRRLGRLGLRPRRLVAGTGRRRSRPDRVDPRRRAGRVRRDHDVGRARARRGPARAYASELRSRLAPERAAGRVLPQLRGPPTPVALAAPVPAAVHGLRPAPRARHPVHPRRSRPHARARRASPRSPGSTRRSAARGSRASTRSCGRSPGCAPGCSSRRDASTYESRSGPRPPRGELSRMGRFAALEVVSVVVTSALRAAPRRVDRSLALGRASVARRVHLRHPRRGSSSGASPDCSRSVWCCSPPADPTGACSS